MERTLQNSGRDLSRPDLFKYQKKGAMNRAPTIDFEMESDHQRTVVLIINFGPRGTGGDIRQLPLMV